MSDLVVRLARATDLPVVAQDGHASQDHIAQQISAAAVWIAEEGTVPLGYLRLEYLWGRVPFIALIRVLPMFRGRGAGRALLAMVELQLGAAGHQWLYSSSQAEETEPQEWHRHMGFIECGFLEGVNATGVGEVFFRKALGTGIR